jgi:predicted DsbA family dithiol-disulfide isomerase
VRIEKLKRNFNVDVKLVHFPLHPDTPPEGRLMAEYYASRGIDPQVAYERMKGRMDAEGLPYGKRSHSYNSRLAQELGKWADTRDGGEALHDALYRAYFVDSRDIGDPEVLLDIVGSVGLSVDAAREVLQQRTFKDAVDADWEKAMRYGISGVPTFVAGGYGVVGAQPYEVLEGLVRQAATEPRSGSG